MALFFENFNVVMLSDGILVVEFCIKRYFLENNILEKF